MFIIKNCEPKNFQIVLRDKNIEFLENNDLSQKDIVNELKKLQPNDYYDGPLVDLNPNRKHPVWIFKKYVRNIYCYIKLKIVNHGKIVIIVSFHENI